YRGRVHVYLGGPMGLPTTPTHTLDGPDGAGSYFGNSVACAGDVNGDGYADLIVGTLYVGRAHLYLGGPNGLAATPATNLNNPDGASGSSFFGAAVASAEDVNGDGYADLIVGAW